MVLGSWRKSRGRNELPSHSPATARSVEKSLMSVDEGRRRSGSSETCITSQSDPTRPARHVSRFSGLALAPGCAPAGTRHAVGATPSKESTEHMRTSSKTRTGTAEIDAYLATLSRDKRAALERLRKTIRAAAPGAEECISYQLPAFRLDGMALVAFGATAKHCAFFPMSGTTVQAHATELERFDTSKGTIRFQPDDPLPAPLVRRLVKARIAENAAKRPARRK